MSSKTPFFRTKRKRVGSGTPPPQWDNSNWGDEAHSKSGVVIRDGGIVVDPTMKPEAGVARWTLSPEDTDGTTALDTWGDNDGAIYGGVQPNVETDVGPAYQFDGSTGHVVLGSVESLQLDAAYTVSQLIRFEKQQETWFFGNYDTEDRGAGITYDREGSGRIRWYDGIEFFTLSKPIETQRWYLVTLSRSGSTYTLYLDGEYEGSITTSQTGFSDSSRPNVTIGSSWGETRTDHRAPLHGFMKNIQIYAKEITSEEAARLYSQGAI
ncbi:LamG-like jellyroll fold domain-containing protein [Halorubrum sp. AJ67]|uniref:LamG-like jellyroll fold domain-containing protein n=1 Tax=Halorubrum sp. AJ67 TaxID=1173487 RepID=UPI00064FE913|nr:LamG-like jellyroll fold domain-containing protein [Halorubrum sp. AJ67]